MHAVRDSASGVHACVRADICLTEMYRQECCMKTYVDVTNTKGRASRNIHWSVHLMVLVVVQVALHRMHAVAVWRA